MILNKQRQEASKNKERKEMVPGCCSQWLLLLSLSLSMVAVALSLSEWLLLLSKVGVAEADEGSRGEKRCVCKEVEGEGR